VTDSAFDELASGTRVGKYEILAVIGRGRTGIVYKGFNHTDCKEVAIKEFFPSDVAYRRSPECEVKAVFISHQGEFEQRAGHFFRESRQLIGISHSGLSEYLDVFEANATCYVIQRIETDQSLKRYLKLNPVSEEFVGKLLNGVLDGLEVLHASGILHRNLKPSNILLREDRTPILIDIGEPRSDLSTITRLAVVHGYVPWEFDSSNHMGPWSDLYSLGAVIYRAVTGSEPLPAFKRLRQDCLVYPEQVAAGKFSPRLLELIGWMLKLKLTERPSSVQELRSTQKSMLL
jgi:serine/threonine protein kinase